MNILWDGIIQSSLPGGGVSRYCADAISALAHTSDHHVMAVCPPGAPPYNAEAPRLRQISEHAMHAVNQWRINRFKPDIFQSGYYGPSLCKNCPVVQIAYDFIDARFPVFQSNKPGFIPHQRKVLEQADAVIAISECTRDDVLRYTDVNPERIRVIYPNLSSVFLKPSTPTFQPPSKPYWLWVGQGSGYKNRITFLRAFSETANETDMQLMIVGGRHAKLSELELDLLLNHKILDRVIQLGTVSDQELQNLYAHAQAFIQSSLWEGFGIPVIEALHAGSQVILSDIPVFKEVAGETATYADPYSADDWVRALKESAGRSKDPEQKDQVRREILNKFSSSKLADQFLEVYENIL